MSRRPVAGEMQHLATVRAAGLARAAMDGFSSERRVEQEASKVREIVMVLHA